MTVPNPCPALTIAAAARAGLIPALIATLDDDRPNGVFGDRDASRPATRRPAAPGCGLFGRLGDDPPLVPNNGTPRPPRLLGDRMQPRGRA